MDVYSIFLNFGLIWLTLSCLCVLYAGEFDNGYMKAVVSHPTTREGTLSRALLFIFFSPAWYVPWALWCVGVVIFWTFVVTLILLYSLLWLTWYDIVSPELSRQRREEYDEVLKALSE